MVQLKLLDREIRENLFHLPVSVLPFVFAPKIIDHEEAAVEEVLAEYFRLRVQKVERAGFEGVEERVQLHRRIENRHDKRLRMHADGGHLLEAEGEIQVAVRIVGCPLAVIFRSQPDEAEGVVGEARVVLPFRDAAAVLKYDGPLVSPLGLAGGIGCEGEAEQGDEGGAEGHGAGGRVMRKSRAASKRGFSSNAFKTCLRDSGRSVGRTRVASS